MGSGHNANTLGSSRMAVTLAMGVTLGREAGRRGGIKGNAFVGLSSEETPSHSPPGISAQSSSF